ncbi:MAG TPA: YhjD/YihY/BrkB family envelope integrity protein [Rugosimonospora sp.]|nr:YhjD/YihY/BrkB family envelope integrity protein [Rugosimonospora sp.]
MLAELASRAVSAWDGLVRRARRRSRVVDRLWLAKQRYGEVHGGRLAAAIAYYGFFAALALGLLAVSILGFVLAGNRAAVSVVNRFLAQNLPFLKTSDIANARQTVAVVGAIGLVGAGIGWVGGMRSAQRAVWNLDQEPGNVVVRRLVDLAMLVGLGLLVALSLWVTGGIQVLAKDLLAWASPAHTTAAFNQSVKTALSVLGQILSFGVNLVVAAALLAGVPRLRMPPRRLLPPVVLLAVGFTLLSTVGRVFIGHTERNPAYQVAGWAVGLLVSINLFSQLLLFGTALAATGNRDRVVDLAAGPPPRLPEDGSGGPDGAAAQDPP